MGIHYDNNYLYRMEEELEFGWGRIILVSPVVGARCARGTYHLIVSFSVDVS